MFPSPFLLSRCSEIILSSVSENHTLTSLKYKYFFELVKVSPIPPKNLPLYISQHCRQTLKGEPQQPTGTLNVLD